MNGCAALGKSTLVPRTARSNTFLKDRAQHSEEATFDLAQEEYSTYVASASSSATGFRIRLIEHDDLQHIRFDMLDVYVSLG